MRTLPPSGWRTLLALQVALVCWLAFSPPSPPGGFTLPERADHVLAFAAMAVSARHGWARAPGGTMAMALLAFGLFIEAVQHFLPDRSAEWLDVLADGLGIALGLALSLAWQRLRKPA